MFSGLSSLVIGDVTDLDGVIVVRARTAGGPVPCPRCGGRTGQVHGYYERTVADVPADGRPVVVRVRVRQMRCPVPGCPVQTFREQVPGVLDRYQRRTTRLAGQAGEVARRLAGRAGAGRRWESRCRGIPRCACCCGLPCPRSPCRGCPAPVISRCAAARSARPS